MRFQGTLFSRLWTRAGDPKRARERLALALSHYEAAHGYYLRHGGRTLIHINVDIFDLYTAVHAASPAGNSDCLEKALHCLVETNRSFNSFLGEEKVELKEGCKMSGMVADRLPKVLLLLAKASSTLSIALAKRATTTAKPSTSVPSSTTAQQAAPVEIMRGEAEQKSLTEGYKALYRSALAFKWPSAEVEEDACRTDLASLVRFLLHDIHDGFACLRRKHL